MNEAAVLSRLDLVEPALRVGFVRRVTPTHVEASGPMATVGDLCEIACAPTPILAEVTAVSDERTVLVPLSAGAVVAPDARVVVQRRRSVAPVGDAFAGRAIDALGHPIDGGAAILPETALPSDGDILAPLERREPKTAVETGLRALDGLLTIGVGQRVGVFSASGVGKTTLVRQLAEGVECDHCILCLVGERGREVEAAWRAITALDDAARYTCVAATSDQSAPLRVRAVRQALCLAEHWRGAGKHVLFILDSATRFAMALREIGLSAGAPPTLRAYTPNVFAALPRLVERCGAAENGGAITAIITVLSETDDVDDPIVELMKSLLDGHIVLSRQLAEQGRFPAIDVLRSVSRQAPLVMSPAHASAAGRATAQLATYEDARVMIESGVYKTGANPKIDEAVRSREALMRFLQQRHGERSPLTETLRLLQQVVGQNGLAHA